MKLYLIRHGATWGNREHRYVGCTDEGILESEKERLRQKISLFPEMDMVFVSPYLRCRQTAEILFSGHPEKWSAGVSGALQDWKCKAEIVKDLREMDFGEFEYKNYKELSGNPDYQRFIDSGGAIGFPGGENPSDFKCRCNKAFQECVRKAQENHWGHVGFVMHGGTIMAIMEEFSCPKLGYYEYQVGNGCGYAVHLEEAAEETAGKAVRTAGDVRPGPKGYYGLGTDAMDVPMGNGKPGQKGHYGKKIKLKIEEEIT